MESEGQWLFLSIVSNFSCDNKRLASIYSIIPFRLSIWMYPNDMPFHLSKNGSAWTVPGDGRPNHANNTAFSNFSSAERWPFSSCFRLQCKLPGTCPRQMTVTLSSRCLKPTLFQALLEILKTPLTWSMEVTQENAEKFYWLKLTLIHYKTRRFSNASFNSYSASSSSVSNIYCNFSVSF